MLSDEWWRTPRALRECGAFPAANPLRPLARSRTIAPMAPRILYLHGFGSGPRSTKGTAIGAHFADRGFTVDRLDLRVPSLAHLRLSAMLDRAGLAIGDARDRAIVIGSSLGGLTAARLAERDPRVMALVLLAPAFNLMQRWKEQLGAGWDDWQRTGWRDITDYTTGEPARIDFGFAEDALALDVGLPDVRVPTLILHGTQDDVVPVTSSRRFADGRRNVRLVELEDDHQLTSSLPHILAEATSFLAPWLT